ncbi:MAG: DUF1302 family protein [Pseudomonadota bacterium]
MSITIPAPALPRTGNAALAGTAPLRQPMMLLIAAMLAGAGAPALAIGIDSGVPGVKIRWDNTLRYNIGVRTESRDSRIAGNPAFDDGDFKFGAGDVVLNRLDLLSELDIAWNREAGVRLSGAAWYDHAYRKPDVKTNPALPLPSGYVDNRYSAYTRRYYNGPSGELLDAFVYANTDLGGLPVSVKAGRLTNFWGMAAFSAGGIAYGQQPIDGQKGATNPGTEVKELFLPLAQLSLQSQLSDTVSFAGQYYFDWATTRIPEGGTYLGSVDFLLNGPQRTGFLPFARSDAVRPGKRGNLGVNLKWTPEALAGATVGLYARKFDEKVFWVLTDPANPLSYRAVYPQDTKLVGLSYDATVGPYAIGIELATRRNAGLQTPAFTPSGEGARGNTWHAVVNTVLSMPNVGLWDTGVMVAELTYDHLEKVTRNAALFQGEGSAACGAGNGRHEGCATRNALGVGVRIAPQYLGVIEGVDLTVPITLTGGLRGNTADFQGTNQGAYTWSVGVEADVRKSVTIALRYTDSSARMNVAAGGVAASGNGSYMLNDRGYVSLTLKTAF